MYNVKNRLLEHLYNQRFGGTMNTKMIGAIVVVVIVLVAAVIVFIPGDSEDDDDTSDTSDTTSSYGLSDNIDGRLTIFGNANEDDYIDYRDVEAVKAIIAGEIEPTYFDCYLTYGGKTVQRCLADANCDGKIDEADVEWIENMVDRKENMQVYFYDVDSVCTSVTYPLSTMAAGYKSNYEAIIICGANEDVLYACNQITDETSTYYQWYHDYFADAQSIGSRFTPDYEVFVAEGNEIPSAFISGTRLWFDEDMEETLAPLGVDVVRLPFWEDNVTVSGIITLGYLLQCEEAAYEYAEMADQVLETIEDAVADIDEEDRPLVFASPTATNIKAMHAGIQEFVYAAGGITPLDVGYSSGDIDAEGVTAMDPDWICLRLYYGFLEEYDTLETSLEAAYYELVNTDLQYLQAIVETTAYAEGNVLIFSQGSYMGPASYINIAYLANYLYPDLFDFDVDALFAEYLAAYHPEWSVEDFEGLQYYCLQDILNYYGDDYPLTYPTSP